MSSTEKGLELELECSLCKDIYREPKTLGCLHSFCLECLEIYVERNHSNIQLKCPICRTPIQFESRDQLSNLSADSFLLSALNIHNTLTNSMHQHNHQKVMCSDGNNEATHYCLDCEEHFCEMCSNAHKTMKMAKHHQLIPIEETKNQTQVKTITNSQIYCQIHGQKEIDLFCNDCKETICSLCVPLHSSHKISTITDVVGSEKRSLFDLINRVKPKEKELREGMKKCEEVIKQLEINATTTQTQINQLFNKIRNKLDEKEQELLNKLEEIEKYKKKELEIQKDGLEFGIESIIGSCQMIENSLSLSSKSDARFLSMKKLYHSRLDYLSNNIWNIDPCHNPFIEFLICEKEEQSIYSRISNIGSIDSNDIYAEKCLILRNSNQKVYEYEEIKFEIISYSKEGNEMKKGGNGKRFRIHIEGESKSDDENKEENNEWSIVDLNNGRYEVKMKVKNEGEYSIIVKCNEIEINSSPFNIQVYPQSRLGFQNYHQNYFPIYSLRYSDQVVKKPEPKIYYSSEGEPMVHIFMKQNFTNCEYIEVNFDGRAINFQQPCFLFIFVVITDRFDDPASWGKWIEKRMKETDGRCVLIRLHSDEKQLELGNPNDIPESIQTASFQFLTKIDKNGIGKHLRFIKNESILKKTLVNFLKDM